MKKFVYLLMSCIMLTACEDDNDEPRISIEHLDSNFQSYLLINFDLDKDGFISEKEAALVTEIEINECEVLPEDLMFFPNLERFISDYQFVEYDIKSMDFTHNPKLKILAISFCNTIEEVDVSNNHELDSLSLHFYLDCTYNNLQQLIVNRKASIGTLHRDSFTQITLAD
jgi:hypothetical protein